MAKNDLKKLVQWADRAAINILYSGRARAAEDVISDLQELGPRWSGRFSNSWAINTPIGTKSGGSGQETNPVHVKAPAFLGKAIQIDSLGSAFKINNSAEYADVACDLTTGTFTDPGIKPLKEPSYGDRNNGKRGEPWPVQGVRGTKGRNRATAPLDWFITYVDGGHMDKTVENAMKKSERQFK
jgi:hypothetical protein